MGTWNVEFLNDMVYQEFLTLSSTLQASTLRITELIEHNGLENIGMPYVRHLQGKLWEIRAKGQDGIARSIYVTVKEKRVVIIRCFQKKTQKTPKKEIQLALTRAKEVTQ